MPGKPKTARGKKTAATTTGATKRRAAAAKSGGGNDKGAVSPEQRWKMISEAAYYLAEKRGFTGHPADDWIEAEKQIDAQLTHR